MSISNWTLSQSSLADLCRLEEAVREYLASDWDGVKDVDDVALTISSDCQPLYLLDICYFPLGIVEDMVRRVAKDMDISISEFTLSEEIIAYRQSMLEDIRQRESVRDLLIGDPEELPSHLCPHCAAEKIVFMLDCPNCGKSYE